MTKSRKCSTRSLYLKRLYFILIQHVRGMNRRPSISFYFFVSFYMLLSTAFGRLFSFYTNFEHLSATIQCNISQYRGLNLHTDSGSNNSAYWQRLPTEAERLLPNPLSSSFDNRCHHSRCNQLQLLRTTNIPSRFWGTRPLVNDTETRSVGSMVRRRKLFQGQGTKMKDNARRDASERLLRLASVCWLMKGKMAGDLHIGNSSTGCSNIKSSGLVKEPGVVSTTGPPTCIYSYTVMTNKWRTRTVWLEQRWERPQLISLWQAMRSAMDTNSRTVVGIDFITIM